MNNKRLSIATDVLHEKRQLKVWRTFVSIIAVAMVIIITNASMPVAVALQGDVYCGLDEHEHTDDCYTTTLTCELDEDDEHTHTDACYEKTLTCDKEEHTHDSECYIDPQAKVENEDEAGNDSVVNVNVSKTWDDDEDHTNDSVTIHLLDEDGNYLDDKYGTKVLSEENGWTDVWENLPEAEYTVEEEETLDGYYARIESTNKVKRSIFVPVDSSEIDEKSEYLIGSKNSDTEYNLWQINSAEMSSVRLYSYTLTTDTPLTFGDKTYSTYFNGENIPDGAKWYFKEQNDLTSEEYSGDLPYYSIFNAIEGINFSHYLYNDNSQLWVINSDWGLERFAIDNQYIVYLKYYSNYNSLIPRYINDRGSVLYLSDLSGSPTKTEYYFFKNIKETDYYFNITNTSIKESVANINVSKTWFDNEDHTNDSVIVHLLDEDGNYLDDTYGTKVLSEENGWADVWENLPEAEYTVEEEETLDGYYASIDSTKKVQNDIFVPVDSSEIDENSLYLIGSLAQKILTRNITFGKLIAVQMLGFI